MAFRRGSGMPQHGFLTFGTGLGAGLILDGHLYADTNDMTGEAGHIRLAEDGPVGYGKAGSLEGFCSGGGLRQLSLMMTGKERSAKELALSADAGDADAIRVLTKSAQMLGKGLALLIDLLNPERIVIGSVICPHGTVVQGRGMAHRPSGDIGAVLVVLRGRPGTAGGQHWRCGGADRRMERLEGGTDMTKKNYQAAVDALVASFKADGKLLCGNGGSSADCAHILGELVKGFMSKRPLAQETVAVIGTPWAKDLQGGLPAIDPTVNGALIAAVSNDIDAASAYAQQVIAYGRKGDVLIGISTSGNAENVRRALQVARTQGLTTIGLIGRGGEKMAALCDILLDVDETETYRVQENRQRRRTRMLIRRNNRGDFGFGKKP